MFGRLLTHLRCGLCGEGSYCRLKRLLGFTPRDTALYQAALTHRSASTKSPAGRTVNNERLEFLGDAVLEAVVTDFLFSTYPTHNEGFLTRMRSRLVSRDALDSLAEKIGLPGLLVSSGSMNDTPRHLSGNALEALIGAVYLDRGYGFTRRFVIRTLILRHIDLDTLYNTESDFKSRLIEWCQKSRRSISFDTEMEGGSHNRPRFVSRVIIDGMEIGAGRGHSKKEAEQNGALTVLKVMDDDAGDYFLDAIDSRTADEDDESRRS